MQNPTGRTRRQTRQSAAAQAAAAERAAGRDTSNSLSHYTPGATLGVPTGTMQTRSSQNARTTRRTTRSSAAMEQEPPRLGTEAPDQATHLLRLLASSNMLAQEDAEQLHRELQGVERERQVEHLKKAVGEERVQSAILMTENVQKAQSLRRAAVLQQSPLASARPNPYSAQRLVGHSYVTPAQMQQVPGIPSQSIRPLTYNQALQMNTRQDPQAFQQTPLAYPLNQRSIASAPSVQAARPRMPQGQVTGEVARTLMPARSDSQSGAYGSLNYLSASTAATVKPMPYTAEFALHSLTGDSRTEADAVPHKRAAAAPIENGTSKSARYTKVKRGVEDPSAPDIGDMDVVTEAAIHLGEEQEALLNDVPTQSVADTDGQLTESALLNVNAVKTRLQQVLREQGMQLSGIEGVEVMIRGMEDKFEAFLKRALKRAIHRCDTGYVMRDSEMRKVTSDVRSKLREIKKKQEQNKANKQKEEREKLELLAATASKKELASNKELAAKVERVKREKQLNIETEATNRALANALGDVGFEKFRREKVAREAAEAAAGKATMPPPPSTAAPPVRPPVTTSAFSAPQPPVVLPKPAEKPPVVEEKRPVVLTVKDIVSVMSQDRDYALSPLLYRAYL